MTQQEFEARFGQEVTPECFDYANRVYMAAGQMDKDEFCKDWKHQQVRDSDVVNALTLEVEVLQGTAKNLGRQVQATEECLNTFRSQMVDFLILQAEKWSATDLREKAIKIVGIREYIYRRTEMKLGLWEADRLALLEILKKED